MGATLRYAKVVDRDHVQATGGLTPATDNLVKLAAEPPAPARDFLVLRAWDVDGGFEERWRLEDEHGHEIYRGAPRTVLAEHGDVFDEVQGVRFEYAGDAYQLVLEVDDREVARTNFAVVVDTDAGATTDLSVPPATDAATAANDPPVANELTDDERAVFAAVADAESSGGPGYAHEIARTAGLDLDTVTSALSRLTGTHDLVQEVATGTGDDPDLGPQYRVKSRP